jgi:hypothetical protein
MSSFFTPDLIKHLGDMTVRQCVVVNGGTFSDEEHANAIVQSLRRHLKYNDVARSASDRYDNEQTGSVMTSARLL